MNIVDFYKKYQIGLKEFFEIYLERWQENPNMIKICNPIKLLNMCKDLPFKSISEEYPIEYRSIMHLMSELENRIDELRTEDVNYYKYQIKPHL